MTLADASAWTRSRLGREHVSEALSRRDLTGHPNGTIDPFFGCDLRSEAGSYALNFSFPWSMYRVYTPLSRAKLFVRGTRSDWHKCMRTCCSRVSGIH